MKSGNQFRWWATASIAFFALVITLARFVHAQSFGIELKNTQMPASGAMAGVGFSRPQDLQSAMNGNPATLTQFRGTQFSFGGSYLEFTANLEQLAPLPLFDVDPYAAKSGTPGALAGNIGVTQDFSALGLPATVGLGFLTNAGAGTDFRDVPESNGTSAHYMALDVVSSLGVLLTDRLSIGGAMFIGSAFLDGPFVDLGGMVPDYALRSSIGANYDLNEYTSVGAYWQSKKSHTFDDAALIANLPAQDIKLDHPSNFGFGIANSRLCDGRLLLAADVLFMHYSDATFLSSIYDDQWAYRFGSQFALTERMLLRLGYGYNDNPMKGAVLNSIGGITLPDGVPGVRYVQGQFAAISQHDLTGGFGLRNVLPGMDMDLFAGGSFENEDQFGATRVSFASYWVGFGLTWRFGRGSCDNLCIPNDWGSSSARH